MTLTDALSLMLGNPADFQSTLAAYIAEARAKHAVGDATDQTQIAAAIGAMTLAVESPALPEWRLIPGGITYCELNSAGLELRGLLRELRQEEFLSNVLMPQLNSLQGSNLAKIACMSMNEELNNPWWHDYAIGLFPAMLRGACGVTTNPVLVNFARIKQPEVWDPVRDRIKAAHPHAGPEDIAEYVTIEVVLNNCRMLRPLWQISNMMGYCSLQLSPETAFDKAAMIADGKRVWQRLIEAFEGQPPNAVFKLPATPEGIEASSELTAIGAGVNMTVNFGIPQQIAVAQAIESASIAPICFRTQMLGRGDDPIGEQLKDAGVSDWEELKTWASTAILQRDLAYVCGELGCSRSVPLTASGRGNWNISRALHAGIIPVYMTVFPDKQEMFDVVPLELEPELQNHVPNETIERLRKSSLFNQLYDVDGCKPEEFGQLIPVQKTLAEFCGKYRDEFIPWCAS